MPKVAEALKELENFHLAMKKIMKYKDSIFSKMELKVLLLVKENNDITMQDIAQELEITKSRVTAIVSPLINKNFLEYKISENDKRKKNIKITDSGLYYLLEHKKKHEKFFEMMWNCYSEEEQNQWLHLKKKTVKIIEEIISREDTKK